MNVGFVHLQLAVSGEVLSALIAIPRSFRVRQHVRFQIRSLVEGSAADRALMRGFFHVQDLVDSESARLAESFTAFGALERLLLAMDVSMISQMVLPPESFSADIARVRPFISMRPLVDEQIVALGEVSVAVFADELLLRSGSCGGFCRRRWTSWHPDFSDSSPLVHADASQPLVHEHSVVRVLLVRIRQILFGRGFW